MNNDLRVTPVTSCTSLRALGAFAARAQPGTSVVVVHLSGTDCEYRMDLTEHSAVVHARVTFCDQRPGGGTWWTNWRLHLNGPSAAELRVELRRRVVSDLRQQRRRFRRLLQEHYELATRQAVGELLLA
jgi:hypothetical protein